MSAVPHVSAVPQVSAIPRGTSADVCTEVFVAHRELLSAIVYNLLGSGADTEDVLQETWLSWSGSRRRATADIGNPRAYLVRIAVNHALARRASIARRREAYVGPWLPEPLGTAGRDGDGDAADRAMRAESVSMAMLVLLETLSPLERAVFVLHEVFGYAYQEIAEILDRSSSAVRQVAHRAREHVDARRPRYPVDLQVQRRVTEQFIAAALGGDLATLLKMLSPEVTMWTDGGGKVRGAGLRPVTGRDKVGRMLMGYALRPPLAVSVRYRHINGDSSALVLSGDSLHAVIVLDVSADDGLVHGVYTVANPDKLTRLDPALGHRAASPSGVAGRGALPTMPWAPPAG